MKHTERFASMRKKMWTLGFLSAATVAQAQQDKPAYLTHGETNLADELHNSQISIYYVDRMDPVRGSKTESIFGTFDEPPSRILAARGPWGREDLNNKGYGRNGLKIVAELQPSADKPALEAGRAGYYTTLKKGDQYFNAARYHHLTFWIRGENGGEKMQIALVDKRSQENGKRLESGSIEAYTERGAIDKQWQRARIPLDIFQADTHELYQIIMLFDNKLYDSVKVRELTVYVDDMAFE
jgi:hypothetical protein